MRRSSMDNRLTSNVVSNRFKPLIAYTIPDRSNASSLIMHHGNLINQENSELDQLTKLLIQSINSSNETNFFGEIFQLGIPLLD